MTPACVRTLSRSTGVSLVLEYPLTEARSQKDLKDPGTSCVCIPVAAYLGMSVSGEWFNGQLHGQGVYTHQLGSL